MPLRLQLQVWQCGGYAEGGKDKRVFIVTEVPDREVNFYMFLRKKTIKMKIFYKTFENFWFTMVFDKERI